MTASPEYLPPSSTTIQSRQNDADALRLLIAQRRLYRRAKRWLSLRWVGMVVIGIGAPVASILWPSLAVVSGAVAGLWLFLGRTLLVFVQGTVTTKAASVQEQFDFYVFQMPDNAQRSTLPSLEDIAKVAGPDGQIRAEAEKEKLLDWYPIDSGDDGAISVAVSQRANASYTDGLLRTTAIVWAVATVVWVVTLIVVSIVLKLSLSGFLLGVALPVLPAFLDVVQDVAGVWRSAAARRDLAQVIEARITGTDGRIDGQDLLVWQERLFDLRRTAPEVPDLLYKIRRKVNERAMHSAARQVSSRAKREDS
ncbi:S-4TM family putative pore-forming effector [Mycobacterium sp. OTB74]|uniref:S-4TM family putative pore-forming effector n=1 Tax=Mycobacterium sp. OTB74 TaxID=1853452 RepID=UPI002476F437|nr:S-4TM family putative pore-forming effector [Mycobacterium sp. OTB74]MDH6242704.1 hypothetical protein [Mycobacterium sp. OTB74]